MLYNVIHGILSHSDKEEGNAVHVDNPHDDSTCLQENTLTHDTNNSRGHMGNTPTDIGETVVEELVADAEAEVHLKSTSGSLEEVMSEFGGFSYSSKEDGPDGRQKKIKHIATVICSMLSFACNCRHNGLQLENSIRFYACGVSETVNEYLHYLGLTSHRKTAVHALRSLASEAADTIASLMALSNCLAPIMCIDNLDMEERIQLASVGKQNRMFHGTWGYIHIPSDNLMKTLDPNQLTLQSYHNALKDVDSLIIDPADFLPDNEAQDHYEKVFKSQIARVMYKYVARPADSKRKLPMDPPDIELISHEQPKIHMMKLMNESDNSAEGIGQVMEALRRQSRLEPGEFFGRFQLIDGDLGTAQIFNAIRSLRFPSKHCNHSLNNVSFTLGAAHTLWNIAHTILTHHFGNSKAMDDLGVWRYLQALGIPPEKVIQEKDFTKMLQYMEQVHEATLWYCLRYVI
ncbi:hypothetical protein PGTUg99_029198 [Puccinia graminis f. sp. tritici]|uniref:DUF6589 domain-containing protein n=1 Tax=Puccinia graminis f. sp. tritici TaxID=56615 RepID=A0A5B0RF57_PUCGR|nr:hypothetical protein PGTUg99_029198 [Puccinia graminis f. sp. tritici]